MIKVSYFRGENELGPTVVPLFGPADSVFEKTAAPLLLPEVTKYISELRPQKHAQYVLVNALGASEYFGCFPAGTLVQTVHGEVPIEQVQVGTDVRTHRNRFRKVQAVQLKECFGVLADLYVQGLPQLLPALTATPNHELRVVLRDEFVRARRAVVYKGDTLAPVEKRREQLFSDISFDWIPMGDLQRGDLIAQPFPLEDDTGALGEVWNDPYIAFLMGLYAAEGCLSYKYDRQDKLRNGELEQPLSGVVFVVGEHEEKTVLRAQKAAGAHGHALTITPGKETHSIRLELSWQGFAELCKDHIGSSAVTKRLSGAVLRMPRNWQKELFSAYAGGDGYTTKSCPGAGSQRCTSASVGLLVDMRLLLARLGVVSSISGRHNKKATWYNCNPVFELLVGSSQLSGAQSQAKSYLHPEGFILSAVHHVEEYAWEGTVYDLQVEEDCSYTASGISVHNSNINGDAFPEAGLIHAPDGWRGVPLYDEITARDWAYGFPTFYSAKPFLHHRNKDYAPHNHPSFGKVELAAWNDRMKRVELVCRVDKELCEKFGGIALWDKLQQGQYPDVSMGTKVPFDTCSICLDWEAYRKAQATYDKKRHRNPGEAILEVHKKKNIRGLSITRKDYCDHALKAMNRILPDGRKVFVYNDFPRFFDISFVFVGADRTAKVMMKIAGEGRSYWSMGGAELAEKMGYSDGSASDETLEEKAASAEQTADQILREGFLGKSAADKEGEMTKNIPAFFAGRAAKMVAKDDVDLPKYILNLLGSTAPEEALSTAGTLGVVLRPREFQRIILIRIGQKPLADEYDKKNVVFPEAEGEERVPLGTEFFNSVLMKLLLPFLSARSGFGPMVEKRVLFSSVEPSKEKKASTSHSSDLLHKIGAAYRNYRRDMMELVATTQDFLSTAGHPSGRDLSKVASAPVDEVFTPLSVAYFNDAFRDEVGSRETTVKTSGVERGSPSRNTWATSQSRTGGQTQ